jgi:hypothetical protein
MPTAGIGESEEQLGGTARFAWRAACTMQSGSLALPATGWCRRPRLALVCTRRVRTLSVHGAHKKQLGSVSTRAHGKSVRGEAQAGPPEWACGESIDGVQAGRAALAVGSALSWAPNDASAACAA